MCVHVLYACMYTIWHIALVYVQAEHTCPNEYAQFVSMLVFMFVCVVNLHTVCVHAPDVWQPLYDSVYCVSSCVYM